MQETTTVGEIVAPKPDEASRPRLWPIATVMATGVFATTLVQTQSLAYLPLNHLLSDMGLDSNQAASFLAWCVMPWSFKVIAGILVDGFPILGSRRRVYLIMSALTASVMWLLMGNSTAKYGPLLALAIGMNVAIVFGSTASGGLLVEAGQRFGASGRLSSLRVFAQNLAAGLSVLLGGFLAKNTMSGKHPLFDTSLVAMVPLLCMLVCSWWLLKEVKVNVPLTAFTVPMRRLLKSLFSWQHLAVLALLYLGYWLLLAYVYDSQVIKTVFWGGLGFYLLVKYLYYRHPEIFSWGMLWSALLIFFIQAVPSFRSTCFYQYQTKTLHYDDVNLGYLGFVGYGVALLGSLIYAWWCRKASLRISLYGAVVVTALSALPYLFYSVYTPYMPRAAAIESIGTLLQYLAYLPLFDLMVRSTPKGSEALGYSVLISVWNIGLAIGTKTGPLLYEKYLGKNMNELIWINALVTLAGIFLVILIPRALITKNEGK